MKYRIWMLAALTLPLGACAGIGDTFYPQTGIVPPISPAPGPDANTTAVVAELQENDDRIDAKRDSGQLSRREARGLRREQRVIGRLAQSYSADGVITDAERRELETRSRVLQGAADNAAFVTDLRDEKKGKKEKPR